MNYKDCQQFVIRAEMTGTKKKGGFWCKLEAEVLKKWSGPWLNCDVVTEMWQMDKRISDSRWSQTVGCKTVRSSITGTPERHKLLRFKIWLHLKTVETFQLFTSVTPSALVFSSLLPHVCIVFLQSCVFPVIFYVLTFISHLCLFFFIQRAGKQMWMTIWPHFYILH